ncbi:glycosyltransferase [Desemzia sp. RIT804]|uniref:glycosyltransferase n=1 Tax=Desemzia sp. RIT 804 TaxID=2810209 RepID=UPI0019503339|nr:glycosyltransferase [Desemzia sp. RIT 804]MBM6615368.1 glycosyltransferase [Desemzia sp. RIT 804]
MEISIGIILYFPTIENINQILTLKDLVEKIYLYDNTDDKEVASKIKKQFSNHMNFEYINGKTNDGMAKALNNLCKRAIKHKHDFIITLDQDSIFEKEEIEEYIYIIKKEVNKDYGIGLFGPQIVYLDGKLSVSDSKKKTNNNTNELQITNREWIITSGSAINLSIFSNMEGFDEKYFIDRVDHDYCKQLRNHNKKIVQINNIQLYQHLGNNTKNILMYTYSEHNSLRNYYMFRNRIYYYNKFYEGVEKQLKIVLGSAKQMILILIFDKNKYSKIKKIVEGYQSYKKGELYEYNNYINR